MSSETKTSSSKPVRKKKLNYNLNDLQVALKEIEEGKLKIREASKKYNIPRGTLQDRIHGRSKTNTVRLGRNSVLTAKEEECMEQWLVNLAKCGFPLKRNDLQNTVQYIVKEDQRPTPFVDQRPGRRWCEAFLKRHPVLNERIPEGITRARAIVTEEYIKKWFRELKVYLSNINATDILEDPTRILNGDETSFSLCPKTGRVIAPKGWKNCYVIKPGSEKETITVMLVFSAAGETVVPMVVFPYVRPPKEVIESIPSNWFLGRSESGWMKSDIFYEYIANGVNNWLIEKEIKKPVLLLVDGHKSHLTMALSEFCDSNGIILYALPANTTHILQPADVSVFRPLKVEWRKTVKEWQRKEENFNRSLTKATFCPLLEQVLEKDMTQTIKNGFRKCGLYPFNPDAVDFTKCVMNTIENFEKDSIEQGDIDTTIKVLEYFNKSLSENGIDINQIINIIKESAANKIENINDSVLDQGTVLNELDINIPTTSQRHGKGNIITDCNTIENYIVNSEGILLKEPENNDFSLSESVLKNIDVASDFSFSLLESPTRPTSAASSTSTKTYQIRSGSNTPTNRGGVSPHFRKHLFSPKSLFFSKKRTKENLPSAISAQFWRDIMEQKNKAKQELDKKKQDRQNKLKLLREEKAKKKEELLRKRAEAAAKKAKQIKKSKKQLKEPPKTTQSHIKCVGCEEDLISDVEDDDLKNIGCDKCPRWFHLKCTVHRGRLYSEVVKEEFICHVC